MQDEDKDKDKDKDGDKDKDKDEDFWQRSRNKAKELLESPCTVELFNAFADGDWWDGMRRRLCAS